MNKGWRRLLLFLLFTKASLSFSEISESSLKDFKPMCEKIYKGDKKIRRICACEELNFKWLVPSISWKDFMRIYEKKEGGSQIEISDDLEALETLVYEITTRCNKKTKYIAPKARSLMNGKN